MTLLAQVAKSTDQADLVILSHIETLRDQQEPATASAVASLIGGAPVGKIYERMTRLMGLQCLELENTEIRAMQLTELGVEVLRKELLGWSPSRREDQRRERMLLEALANPRRR